MSLVPGTNKRRVVLALVCLVAVVGGVQLLDPFEQTAGESIGEPPAEDRPAAVLNYSVSQLRTTSYTLSVTVDDDGNREEVFYAEMDYPAHEYFYRTGFGDVWTLVYVYPDGAWEKTPDSDWRHQGLMSRGDPTPGEPEARPYHAEYILPNQTSVHNRTADALWIRVDGNRQNAIAPQGVNGTGYTLYELNPDTYQIRRALEYGRANDTVQAVHEFDSYGETDVSRPKATRNLAVNLLSDLVR